MKIMASPANPLFFASELVALLFFVYHCATMATFADDDGGDDGGGCYDNNDRDDCGDDVMHFEVCF